MQEKVNPGDRIIPANPVSAAKVMNTFPRSMRLRQRGLISRLFRDGKHFYIHPFKVLYLREDASIGSPCQVLFSVSRKRFKRAVDRNKIRRLMKEAYRQHFFLLQDENEASSSTLFLAIVYTGKVIPTYLEVRDKIMVIQKRLSGDYEKPVG